MIITTVQSHFNEEMIPQRILLDSVAYLFDPKCLIIFHSFCIFNLSA